MTGATGCLGRHLVESLLESATPVRALVRESSRTDRLEEQGVEIERGSLVERDDVAQAVEGVDTVYHLGGVVVDDPTDTSDELWQEIHKFNVEGSELLAREGAAAGVKRFVFVSSVRIFGFGNQMLWPEDGARTASDLYSRGKAMAEEALNRVGEETGLGVVHVRPRFIYGEGDRFVLPKLVKQVRSGWSPVVGGDAICDVVYARDCAQALVLAAERGVPGEAYNVTSGECLSLREIMAEVGRALGKRVRFVPLPAPLVVGAATGAELASRALKRPAPISRAQLRWYLNDHHFSISKAREELGYEPQYPLPRALEEIDLTRYFADGG